jgi:hypothetical protein
MARESPLARNRTMFAMSSGDENVCPLGVRTLIASKNGFNSAFVRTSSFIGVAVFPGHAEQAHWRALAST